jgi:chromosome partitioning protein
MVETVCIANQKGGVGKTTTAVNLSASIAVAEKKTLLIDMDPQGNASTGLGFNNKSFKHSIYHVLLGIAPIQNVILKTELKYLDVIPSTINLIGAEIELLDLPKRESRLKMSLKEIMDDYEYIILDSPPSLGILTINSLTAADSVLIPMQCEYYAMEGLSQLLKTIDLVKKRLNSRLYISGILLTMFDIRNNLSHQVEKEIRNHFKDKVYNVIIPRNVKLSEAPSYGKPIILYDIKSKGAKSYLELAKEFIYGNG